MARVFVLLSMVVPAVCGPASAYYCNIAALSNKPTPPNPVTVSGWIVSTNPVQISDGSGTLTVVGLTDPFPLVYLPHDGSGTLTVAGLTPDVTNYVIVQGNCSNGVLTATTFPTIITYTITARAGPGGFIMPSGTMIVWSGASKFFTFQPNPHYAIDDVKVDGESKGAVFGNAYSFDKVSKNHTIDVSFRIITHTITASCGDNGWISPYGCVTVNDGADQWFSITPDDGYAIDEVLVGGQPKGPITASTTGFNFRNVTADRYDLCQLQEGLHDHCLRQQLPTMDRWKHQPEWRRDRGLRR